MIQNAVFVESCLKNLYHGSKAQNGYDVSIKIIKYISSHASPGITIHKSHTPDYSEVDVLPEGKSNYPGPGYFLPAGVYSVTFNEGGEIPQGYCGWFTHRSSLVRCGAFITSGLYDTGFQCDEFGALLFVLNSQGIYIQKNARIAQFVMAKAEETELYNGQFQGAKDKK